MFGILTGIATFLVDVICCGPIISGGQMNLFYRLWNISACLNYILHVVY